MSHLIDIAGLADSGDIEGLFTVEHLGAAFGAHRGARRIGAVAVAERVVGGWMLIVSVAVDPVHPVVRESL